MVDDIKGSDPLDMAADLLFGAIERIHTNSPSIANLIAAAQATAVIDQARTMRAILQELKEQSAWLERIENKC